LYRKNKMGRCGMNWSGWSCSPMVSCCLHGYVAWLEVSVTDWTQGCWVLVRYVEVVLRLWVYIWLCTEKLCDFWMWRTVWLNMCTKSLAANSCLVIAACTATYSWG
jgi:hypothetical protein